MALHQCLELWMHGPESGEDEHDGVTSVFRVVDALVLSQHAQIFCYHLPTHTPLIFTLGWEAMKVIRWCTDT